jgi:hypothetical protein
MFAGIKPILLSINTAKLSQKVSLSTVLFTIILMLLIYDDDLV